jgi:hypothetical protein
MKSRKLIVLGLVVMVVAFGLTGCKIISASPNPGTIIDMKPGDKQIFKVVGPVNSFTTRCVWVVRGADGPKKSPIGSNVFEFQANPEGERINKIIIQCYVENYEYVQHQEGGWFEWVEKDSRQWKIRILQDTKPTWAGSYKMEDDTDLQLLKDYTAITGSLIIYNPKLTSLAGLESLTTVGECLYIHNNDALTSLSGLENVRSVGGDLDIGGNDALISLSGFENLSSIGGNLGIWCNSALINLTGLENLTSVGGKLYIEHNAALTSLTSLENIISIGGGLSIYDNSALTNLSGLENVTSVVGSLEIWDNYTLTSLSGLENITSVGGDLSVWFNDSLASLSGLENITSIGVGLIIEGNAVLTTLSGLNKIKTVGYLYVNNNSSLVSLGMSDLSKVTHDPNWMVYAFKINANSALCNSLAEELRDQVLTREGVDGESNVEGNKDCTTP